MKATRHSGVLRVRPEKLEYYKQIHRSIWPEMAEVIRLANFRNYSIYLRKLPDGHHYLFGYFEHVGDDFAGDMERMAAHPVTKEWWAVCKPCQEPLPDRSPEEWWAGMEEVFHQD
ncbi:MAG TPA: L-rhamnose mutarotase [Opitutaceae bacterium]|nr:L-rhamnose mutarotase [Opitutaceae bacterium]